MAITPVTYTDSMVWDLYLKLDLHLPPAPTQIISGHYLRRSTYASGYFLEIGASGDQDPLELKYLIAEVVNHY